MDKFNDIERDMYPHNLDDISDTMGYLESWKIWAWKDEDYDEYEAAILFQQTLRDIHEGIGPPCF